MPFALPSAPQYIPAPPTQETITHITAADKVTEAIPTAICYEIQVETVTHEKLVYFEVFTNP